MPILAKDIIFRLMDRIEELYIENATLREELRNADQNALNETIQHMKDSVRVRQHVAARFAPVRAALLRESLEEQALLELLRGLPPIDVKNMS